MKRISQLFLVSIVGVFVVFFALGQSPVMAQDSPQGVNLELEVDWPSIPGIGTLNDLVSDGLTLNELIVFVYTFLLWLSIILAFLALIYAGFLYVVSGANPSARSRAFDYVKRIVTGGTILLLTVLILSFINTDLVEIEEGVAVNAYCHGPNTNECKRKIRDGGHLVAQSYNVDSGAFEYEIRTTSVQDMERRLIDVGVDQIEKQIRATYTSRVGKPFIDKIFSSEGVACPIECKGGDTLCSVRENLCQKYDFDDSNRISEADFRNTNLLNILTALTGGEVEYNENADHEGIRNAEINKSIQRWNKLNELIEEDKTKYEDNAGDVSVRYIFAQDDDAAPSCAAQCVYRESGWNDSNISGCVEIGNNYSGEDNKPKNSTKNLRCGNWGNGSEGDGYQREKKNLKLEKITTNTTPNTMCKIKQGVSDDDFKRDYNGRERAKCAATYVADSFIVPLVGKGVDKSVSCGGGYSPNNTPCRNPTINVSPVIIGENHSNYVDEDSILYGCYCQQP